jgi:hypothetical protein
VEIIETLASGSLGARQGDSDNFTDIMLHGNE